MLLNIGSRIVVRIEIRTVLFAAWTMTIAQMVRHRPRRPLLHFGKRIEVRLRGGIRFGSERHIDCRLGKIDAAFGVAYHLSCSECSLSDKERLRVGIADIFRGQDEDATRDELWVFPKSIMRASQ